jgi:hypothetical protein
MVAYRAPESNSKTEIEPYGPEAIDLVAIMAKITKRGPIIV